MTTDAGGLRGDGQDTVYEAETLADLADLFGPDRLSQLLAGLDAEIVQRLESATPDDPSLAGNAHALVSVSGTLGFMAMSRACAALEQASLGGADAAEPLRVAQDAAAQARRSIAHLNARQA